MEVTKWLKPDDELSRARGEGPRRRYSSRDDRLCRRAAEVEVVAPWIPDRRRTWGRFARPARPATVRADRAPTRRSARPQQADGIRRPPAGRHRTQSRRAAAPRSLRAVAES